MPGEIGFLQLKLSIQAQLLATLLLNVMSFEFFRKVVAAIVKFIRTAFLMKDNPSFARSYWRYLKLYLLIVPLPAAVMRPVLHAQRELDLQLALAATLMILINALGDVLSIRLFLRIFESSGFEPDKTNSSDTIRFWRGVRNEARYYLRVGMGAGSSLVVLVGVLMLSNILFAVQTGQLDIEFSMKFLKAAWHYMINFSDLVFEPYWFKGEPAPFLSKGIPGLFLYGVITFIPAIILFLAASVWLLILPIRIAITQPGSTILRIVSAELSVLVLCIAITQAIHFNLFGFLRSLQA